jgi:hypothetical protein
VQTYPYHPDEISWFFHTEFYQLLYSGNFSSPKWQSYESYDHPQLSKYIFGLTVSLFDKNVFKKREELEKKYGRWSFYFNPQLEKIAPIHFGKYIDVMRNVNVFFTLISVLLIWSISTLTTGNMYASLITTYIVLNNELFKQVMLRATSDAQTICFMLLSWYALLVFTRSNYAYKYIVYFVIASGLSVSSKLTGIISFFAYNTYVCTSLLIDQKSKIRNVISQYLCAVLGIYIIWAVLNPTVYSHPYRNSYSYIDFRLKQSVRLQQAYPEIALTTVGQRSKAIVCTLIATTCGGTHEKGQVTNSTWLNVALCIFGLFFVFIKIKNTVVKIINGSFMYATIVLIVGYIPLNMDRYFLPLALLALYVQSLGILYLVSEMLTVSKKIINPAKWRG